MACVKSLTVTNTVAALWCGVVLLIKGCLFRMTLKLDT